MISFGDHEPEQLPEPGRKIRLRSFNDVEDDVPTWGYAPTFGGAVVGSIPIGSLTALAGRPGAGKSSGGRWFCSQVTHGTLPGEWFGTPHNVAYIAGEESLKYNVKPGLRAAGADLSRVVYPEVNFTLPDGASQEVPLLPEKDMEELIDLLKAEQVKMVVVDPLMEFVGGGTDINKNNEVREKLRPWNKLADAIDGVVLGIVHLNKSGNGDVVAGINGSSAFGEVARAVLGFAKDPESEEGHRIMSQEKNSMGSEDLAFTYRIKSVDVTTSTGKTAAVGAFEIVGESDKSVGEVLRSSSFGSEDGSTGVKKFVLELLESNGGMMQAGDVRSQVEEAGYSWKTVQNSREKWGVMSKKVGPLWKWSVNGLTFQPAGVAS